MAILRDISENECGDPCLNVANLNQILFILSWYALCRIDVAKVGV